ncbi:peroxiredoxin [Stakelama pacifica]|uniref:thioredoxin-dependent peroxiredoxin n=1 Tax=Stakelama pacifica TaxID=517720 RepID=A0A4R6FUL8_9SPHN|nr:peroxiredoxin [Stakelama pacifica]TDN85511.1 peroxiredoxin [Stakelama pacifica]GGO92432.1 peroxiredoxin [Stakelama pacifica]
MRPFLLAPMIALAIAAPASAQLREGTRAPEFVAKGAMAGKPITVDLAAALKKGPVVLYFFPAAFTSGCNAEAAAFAQSIDKFKAKGASVIGMTAGNTDRLIAFSAKHCAGKFPVAAAGPEIVQAYDVAMKGQNTGYTDRTSYVIGRNGKIVYSFSSMQPAAHITNTLAALDKIAH